MVMDKDEDEVLMVRRVEDGLGLPSRAGGAKDTARLSIRLFLSSYWNWSCRSK